MKIKEFREAAGITQDDLAKKLDVHQSAVSHWEHGRTKPARKYHKKLARLLKCSVEELFSEEGEA